MFPGRPVPQQQNPWELAPEVYVARGRNLGKEEGYQEGWNDGWNAAVAQANQVIGQQQRMMQELQEEVRQEQAKAKMYREKFNQHVLLGCAYFDTIETLKKEKPETRKAVLSAFKRHYLREMDKSLKKGVLPCSIHRDAAFLKEAPMTRNFILEAVMS